MAFDITEFDTWKAWITIGKAFQKSKFLPRYDENSLLYKGPEGTGIKSASRDLTVNVVGPTVDSLISSYYARNPKPIVTPRRAEFKVTGRPEALKGEDGARLIEDLVFHTFEEKKVKGEIK